MKIKKTVTAAVIAANRQNSKQSTGPKSERGKEVVSQNAWKHGGFAENLRFESDEQQHNHNALLKALRHTIDRDNPAEAMKAELLATEYHRYGQTLKLDRRIYTGHCPGNQVLEAIGDHELLHLDGVDGNGRNDWPCQELSLSTGEAGESEEKRGEISAGRGNNKHVHMDVRFSDPANTVLRVQAAAERRLYRALRNLEKVQKRNGRKSKKQ